MRVSGFRLAGIRCFEDTGLIQLSPKINIFTGQNNTGKSTLLKALMGPQMEGIQTPDMRSGVAHTYHQVLLTSFGPTDWVRHRSPPHPDIEHLRIVRGNAQVPAPAGFTRIDNVNTLFEATRPRHAFVPFLARRKAVAFEQDVSANVQAQVSGTLSNLYSRVDQVAVTGHPRNPEFVAAVRDIIGLPLTTRGAQPGKVAGFYLNEEEFITLDRLGDGVAEMLGLIVELCLERGKIFLLEEPETNIHPKGLRALLALVRSSANQNQFIIATHSNIVLRELGAEETTKVFRVYRDGEQPRDPCRVQEVERTPAARRAVLRELGYEFADMDLHEAWLFLEESSAEQVINEVLIPFFAPELTGRLRTYSAAGVSNLEPAMVDFQRLVTFVHLQPVYQGHTWIRTDGDPVGVNTAETIRNRFPYLTNETCRAFVEQSFERYYPAQFADRVATVLAIQDRSARRAAKAELLRDVLTWTRANRNDAMGAWNTSAAEPIALLVSIRDSLA